MQPSPETASHNLGGLTHWYSFIQSRTMIAHIINSAMLFKVKVELLLMPDMKSYNEMMVVFGKTADIMVSPNLHATCITTDFTSMPGAYLPISNMGMFTC